MVIFQVIVLEINHGDMFNCNKNHYSTLEVYTPLTYFEYLLLVQIVPKLDII